MTEIYTVVDMGNLIHVGRDLKTAKQKVEKGRGVIIRIWDRGKEIGYWKWCYFKKKWIKTLY